MRRQFTVSFLILCSAIISGCGSAQEVGRENDGRSPVANRPAQQARPEANVSPTGDANQTNTNALTESPQTANRSKSLDVTRRAGNDPSAPKPDVEEILKKSTRPAPEDSEFAVSLTDILVERRTFLNHPVLAQVEKITEGQKGSIRVQTRDGRLHTLPGEAIDALSTVPSSTILGLLKIELPAQPPSQSKRKTQPKN